MAQPFPWRGGPPILSVSELTFRIKELLEAEIDEVWVGGEMSNLRLPPSGHLYFTLKDKRSQIAAVMFRTAVQALPFRPADGMEVVVKGRVGLYPVRGDIQLYVEFLEPRGLGALQLALEQVKAKLAAEGLFAAGRKRPLPFLPQRVGVVTALGGAALRDILTILFRRFPNLHVVIRPVRVQGVGAAAEIAAGIEDLNTFSQVEVIIVGRGGGSIEDLWAFNEEPVVRAIASSRIPVVSAVGHEIDFTLADLAADQRAPTPTAAAEMVVPRKAELLDRVGGIHLQLWEAIRRVNRKRRTDLEGLAERLRPPRRGVEEGRLRVQDLWRRASSQAMQGLRMRQSLAEREAERFLLCSPLPRVHQLLAQVAQRSTHLSSAMRGCWERGHARLRELSARLDELSPLAVLQRGYSIVQKLPAGGIVTDAGTLSRGERLLLRFARGQARSRVEEVE